MKKAERKNQKNLGAPVSVQDVVGLREAALELQNDAPLKRSSKSFEVGRLLRGLQIGLLTSGFILKAEPFVWVQLPPSYWLKVTGKKFKVIRINENGKGGYFVSPTQFSGECASALSLCSTFSVRDKASIETTLRETLAIAARPFEVWLWRNEAWEEYKAKMLEEAIANGQIQSKRGSGRTDMPGWKIVYRILAANKLAKKDFVNKTALVTRVLNEAHQQSEANIRLPQHKAVMTELDALDDHVKKIS
jgi:hypothetical protein